MLNILTWLSNQFVQEKVVFYMKRKLIFSMIVIALLNICTLVFGFNREDLKNIPNHYSQFDVSLGWKIDNDNGRSTINGLLQNIRYATMEQVEVWVTSYDVDGKKLDRSVGFVIPPTVQRDDIVPFTVKFNHKATSGTRLTFTYKYLGKDGGGPDEDSTNWMQSFDATVP
jgi:hypothetical protein